MFAAWHSPINNWVYRVLGSLSPQGWTLSRHQKGRSPRTHTLRPLSALFIKEFGGGGCGFKSESESLPQAQVSRNIGVILREMRALLYQRVRARDREGLRVRDGEIALCVKRARMESFQNALCSGWCGDSCPGVSESCRLEPRPLEMATFINPLPRSRVAALWRRYERQQKVKFSVWLRLNPRTRSPNNRAERSFRI